MNLNKFQKSKTKTHRDTGVAPTLRPRHVVKVPSEQVRPVLLLARAAVLQRPHAVPVQAQTPVEESAAGVITTR